MANQSVNILHYSLIHLQFLRASDAKLTYVATRENGLGVKFKKKRKKPSIKGDAGTRRFATTIFSTTQRCNIVLDACNTVSILQRCVALKVVFADRPV